MTNQQVNKLINEILTTINEYNNLTNEYDKEELKEYILERFGDLEMEFALNKISVDNTQALEIKKIVDFLS